MADIYDPITTIHRGIWQILTNDPTWKDLVSPGNRIDTTAPTFEEFKGEVQAGQLPEVVIVQGPFSVSEFNQGGGLLQLQLTYPMLTTALRVNPVKINQIVWRTIALLFTDVKKVSGRVLNPCVKGISLAGSFAIASDALPEGVPASRGTDRSHAVAYLNFKIDTVAAAVLKIDP